MNQSVSAQFTAEPSDDWKQLFENNLPLSRGRGALRLLRSSRVALTQPDRFATGASPRPRPFANPLTATNLNVQGAPAGSCCFLKVVMVVSKSQCAWVKNGDAPQLKLLNYKALQGRQIFGIIYAQRAVRNCSVPN